MASFGYVYKRIKDATNVSTQLELANILGIRQSSISVAKKRGVIPKEWYMKLYESHGLNPDWLQYGAGSKYLRRDFSRGEAIVPQKYMDLPNKNNACICSKTNTFLENVYAMACACTEDNFPEELQLIEQISLPQVFLNCTKNVILKVDAINMEPTIMRDAYIVVEKDVTHIVSGSMYVMWVPYEGLALYRPFFNNSDNSYLLRSDAHNYPETSCSIKVLNQRLFGRVVWVFQKI